jgi:antitoxin component of MazEF toxin-antitoxin module
LIVTQAIVGKWGNNLAIRVPLDVARAMGLREGEPVEIEECDGELHVRRKAGRIDAETQRKALAAVEEIRLASRQFNLGGITIRELIDEGRKY